MISEEDFLQLVDAARKTANMQTQLEAERKNGPAAARPLVELMAALETESQRLATLQSQSLQARSESIRVFARRHEDFAKDYEATPQLRTAIRVALTLGRPLLLTGEPGTGKTLCAYWLSQVFGDRTVLRFQVRSESRARDLLYSFDAASWFRKCQIEQAEVPKANFIASRELGIAFGWDQTAATTRPAVVLIDEIDKAPRDFPNDLLHELDQMSFRVEETGQTIACPPEKRPIVVITSNAERQLPPPFLRRCIVHHIKLDQDTVLKILRARLAGFSVNDDLLGVAAKFWTSIDKEPNLTRKPTIDEYWRWLALEVQHGAGRDTATAIERQNADSLIYLRTLLPDSDIAKVLR
jgi:MoxR-like ATPase